MKNILHYSLSLALLFISSCGYNSNFLGDPSVESDYAGGVATAAAESNVFDFNVFGASISPSFDFSTLSYTGDVGFYANEFIINPIFSSDYSVSIDSTPYTSNSGGVGYAISTGGSQMLNMTVTDSNGVQTSHSFTFNRPAAVSQTFFKAQDVDTNDQYGTMIDGDGNTFIVTVPFEDSSAVNVGGDPSLNDLSNSGAAYVYVESNGVFTQQAYLKAFNPETNDFLGFRGAAISGDIIAIAATNEDSNATGINGNELDNSSLGAGAVYTYVRNGTTWSPDAYIKSDLSETSDQFGYSLALDGNTLVVGVIGDDSNATVINGDFTDNSANGAGSVYVFVRENGVWSRQAYLKASNAEAADLFGHTVDISGDTIVVGAYLEDSNATGVNGNEADNSAVNSGAAYVFVRNGTTWSQQAYLKASNTDASDNFGFNVSISEDTIAVGSQVESSNATGIGGNQLDNSANGSGAVYIFTRSGTVWSQQAYIKSSNSEAADNFGGGIDGLDIEGDLLIVGAPNEDSNAVGAGGSQADNSLVNAGAAYIFERSGTTWSQIEYLKHADSDSTDNFGHAVCIAGGRIAVGAHADDSNVSGIGGAATDNSSSSAGAVFTFE